MCGFCHFFWLLTILTVENVLCNTVVKLATDPKSGESFYLIKITEEEREKAEDVDNGFGHVIKKGMKGLERVFFERKFDSDNLYTIPKNPKSAFFFREMVVFPSVLLESKKGHFELTNEELLMIIKYMELSNRTSLFWQTVLVACLHVLNLVFLSLVFVCFLTYQFIPETTISVPVFCHIMI